MNILTSEEIEEMGRLKGKRDLIDYTKEVVAAYTRLDEDYSNEIQRLRKAKDQDISNLNNEVKALEVKCKALEEQRVRDSQSLSSLNQRVKSEQARYDTALEVMQIFAGSMK